MDAENDLGRSDRHYTHGTRISWASTNLVSPELRIWRMDPCWDESSPKRSIWYFGQHIYTSSDTSDSEPQLDDRPWGGGSYIGHRVEQAQGGRLDSWELQSWIIGPSSLAGDTQTWFHKITGNSEPKGWDNQLEDEPGILVARRASVSWGKTGGGFGADLVPSAAAVAGNIFTFGEVGLAVRTGWGVPNILQEHFMAPRGSMPFRLYAVAGTKGRAVGWNIFLDGNLFRDSQSVEKEILVNDTYVGIHADIWRIRASFYNTWRSREFKEQDHHNEFSSVALSVVF